MANETCLKDYPIYFNTTALFRPESWKESPGKIENTNQSEAGTDLVNLVRVDKMKISARFDCTSEWKAVFDGFNDLPSFTLKTYDARTEAYKERTVRMQNFNCNTLPKSDYLTSTMGLHEISFDLVQI